ncbi:A-kinase anchor protein 1, mitochondrial-like isoform X1 [Macrosteles quadrilineatus]|uniref:A-kinase anchor protein 1, mitochondrial-like isoform X1 n=1 Tax=Macrosteles quadrilineatus TaxID=74068 RepID=UPI0023E2AB9C|nr:A-kinase anchor protein 1, mitochondrial-like isoform X1 [Macrosteles quadrilineatus]XP_054271869.1 A-kinase anchor protein 1, mitochondrial-like isoform X1 [Macrosteles quadrilineatus]
MVPCQPRQLVILSLPFAALVAFFWFKRRKSLSRSDPGGTPVRPKPGDTAIKGDPQTSEVIKKKIETVEAIKTAVEVKKPSVEEAVVAKTVAKEECFRKSIEEEAAELVKSLETDCAEIKEIVCNSSAVQTKEENPCQDFENNQIFHSTIIESEKDFEEKHYNLVLIQEEEVCVEEVCEKEAEKSEQCCESNQPEAADLEQTLTVAFEDQSTLEYNPTKKTVIEESHTSEATVIDNNCASSSTDTENTSVDTGLGSQDPSTVEENTMAQGQKTEKNESNTTGLEEKLASLGLDTTQQPAQRSERDSANHSPAEVMLNSPAISTFSDAHSEVMSWLSRCEPLDCGRPPKGSSDSGKGCSDVVTPPSRTPAGGSSVAGDLAPSVYEFVLPQVIVGRLIGRHGTFLHDIRAKTHTHVFIKKHPETSSLKICAIEGTQQDIDAALKMIRQKFPIRRFPDLTLEKVSFVKDPCMPMDFESLQLHLVEGVNNDVILSSLITAGNFFLQMPSHLSYQCLYKLACLMNTVYNTQESPALVEPQPNVVCVAPAHGGWYRAQIMTVDEETNTTEVKFLDYGGYMTVDNSCLRQIRGDFLMLPFQAVECVLANVVPAGGEECWSEEARQFVQLMTTNQTLQAQVYDYTEAGLPLVYLYCTQFYQSLTDPSGYETKVVLLNQELVSQGYADVIQEDQAAEPESS